MLIYNKLLKFCCVAVGQVVLLEVLVLYSGVDIDVMDFMAVRAFHIHHDIMALLQHECRMI